MGDLSHLAISLDNLAAVYQAQGKHGEAELLAPRLDYLARLYYAEGKYAEAEPLYKRSVAIQEQALGPAHPDVAQSLNNLAEIYRLQGRYAKMLEDRWKGEDR